MTYLTIAIINQDPAMRVRVAAAVASRGIPNPEDWVAQHAWALAVTPGWADSWEYAVAAVAQGIYVPVDGTPADPDLYQPGRDSGVITDAMIDAAIDAILAAPTPPGEGEDADPPAEAQNEGVE